jgi:uncharacterized membrane protein
MTIRNPIEWGIEAVRNTASAVDTVRAEGYDSVTDRAIAVPVIRHIGIADIKIALERGFADFTAGRTDVLFIAVIYPVLGLIFTEAALNTNLLPLLFPMIAGFALVGPLAGLGLYEMSRRRERGETPRWADALSVFKSPALGGIIVLGVELFVLLGLWLVVANFIYTVTIGAAAPDSVVGFLHQVLTTGGGFALIVFGTGIGFIFAVVVLSISVISFPLMLDRNVSVGTAMATSVRSVIANPVPMAVWGIVVAGGLMIGSLPLLLGLVVIMPVLGHATWHLYRAVVA